MQKKYKERLINFFQQNLPRGSKAYLFGSRARGDNQVSSDIDIAFLGLPDDYRISRLSDELDSLNIPIKIDLVNLNKTSQIFTQQVQSEYTLLFEQNE